MVAGALIVVGAVLMIIGMITMGGWISGQSAWFRSDVYDRAGGSKDDRWLLYATFLAMVLAPLLVGSILIVYGVQMLW